MKVTIETVTIDDIEKLADWVRASGSHTRAVGVVERARMGGVSALSVIADLINERMGPWDPEGVPPPRATPKPVAGPSASAPPDERDGPVRLGLGPEWDAEIERRLDLADLGLMKFYPAEEVFEELAQKYPSVRRALRRATAK